VNPSDSTENTVNQQTIEDVEAKMDLCQPKSPGIDWKWLASLAGVLVGLALVTSVVVFGFIIRKGQEENDAKEQQNNEIVTCARRYATRVQDAQVANDLAFGRAVLSGASTQEEKDRLKAILTATQTDLDVARDERLKYELVLTLPCPIQPPIPNTED